MQEEGSDGTIPVQVESGMRPETRIKKENMMRLNWNDFAKVTAGQFSSKARSEAWEKIQTTWNPSRAKVCHWSS
jgi:hypothetical protein